jgi:hypothetical protein
MTRFRRNHPRIEEPAVVAVLPHGRDRAEVRLRDLSASGTSILTDATLPVGALIDLELLDPSDLEEEPVAVRARIVRVFDPPQSGMAVEFVELAPGETLRLLGFVERQQGRFGTEDTPGGGVEPSGTAHGLSETGRSEPRRFGSTGPSHPATVAVTPVASESSADGTGEVARLRVALAEARVGAARADELAARVRTLERELEEVRSELEGQDRSRIAGEAEAREVTLGPDTVRTLEDFTDRLKRGARLRPTERFRTLQPVTRADYQLADWLRGADRFDDLDSAARQLGGTDQLAAAIYRFFENGLVRITR